MRKTPGTLSHSKKKPSLPGRDRDEFLEKKTSLLSLRMQLPAISLTLIPFKCWSVSSPSFSSSLVSIETSRLAAAAAAFSKAFFSFFREDLPSGVRYRCAHYHFIQNIFRTKLTTFFPNLPQMPARKPFLELPFHAGQDFHT